MPPPERQDASTTACGGRSALGNLERVQLDGTELLLGRTPCGGEVMGGLPGEFGGPGAGQSVPFLKQPGQLNQPVLGQ